MREALRRFFGRFARPRGRSNAADEAASAEVLHELRRAVASIVAGSSLSAALKARLLGIADRCARWDELRESVLDLLIYLQDLVDIGGEDYGEINRVKLQIRELAVTAVIRGSSLSTPARDRLLVAAGECAGWTELRERVTGVLTSLEHDGREDRGELRRVAARVAAIA